MRTYAEFSPTPFDPKGAFLRDQGEWLVAPVGQNRDSGALDRSNFTCALELLGGESDTVEVHRFGHWGPGWFEIIIIDPNSPQVEIAKDLEAELEDYPVVNEDHWRMLEYEEACEYWESLSVSERMEYLQRARESVFAARRSDFGTVPDGTGMLQELLNGC